ncbi:MAG: hypothetical protein EXS05_01800 [Planctomycetaceae bacterium]|nr:hypothetical protein [Planctomycetaceae bacterium]
MRQFRPFDSSNECPESRSPALLVSVRNRDEAVSAIAGGCDILDIKEPSRGSLGMAQIPQISAVIAVRDELAPSLPVSVALGEVVDYPLLQPVRLPGGIDFCKLGTAQLSVDPGWRDRFRMVQDFWNFGSFEGNLTTPPAWVAVAYADWRDAKAVDPQEVVSAAVELNCRGVLIDTCTKGGQGVFDWLSVVAIRDLAEYARHCGLWFALAGRLTRSDLGDVRSVAPDIVGIRSAACRNGRRDAEIDIQAVQNFRRALTADIVTEV